MTLDWAHFTPWTSLAGGILIGVAAAMLAGMAAYAAAERLRPRASG